MLAVLTSRVLLGMLLILHCCNRMNRHLLDSSRWSNWSIGSIHLQFVDRVGSGEELVTGIVENVGLGLIDSVLLHLRL